MGYVRYVCACVCVTEVCVLIHLITLNATAPVDRLQGAVTMATGQEPHLH